MGKCKKRYKLNNSKNIYIHVYGKSSLGPSGRKQTPLVRIWETPHPQLTSKQYPFNAHIAVFVGSPKQARSTYFRSKVSWDDSRLYGII